MGAHATGERHDLNQDLIPANIGWRKKYSIVTVRISYPYMEKKDEALYAVDMERQDNWL